MALRLSGQSSIFGVVFFASKSTLGIERQKKLKKIYNYDPKINISNVAYFHFPLWDYLEFGEKNLSLGLHVHVHGLWRVTIICDVKHPRFQRMTERSMHISILYLKNRKHVPCFYQVIQTQVEVWEKDKMLWDRIEIVLYK